MANRITTAYCEGLVDPNRKILGHSNLLFGERVSKSDPACSIYSKAEHCRVAFTDCIQGFGENYEEEYTLFSWLEENFFALSSYAFMKGNTNKYSFPRTTWAYLKSRILVFKKGIPEGQRSSDFLMRRSPFILLLDKARISVRDLEQEYVRWWHDPRVVADLYTHLWIDPGSGLERFNNMVINYHILNTLSSYLFWFARFVIENNSNQNTLPDKEWSCSRPLDTFPFDLPEDLTTLDEFLLTLP